MTRAWRDWVPWEADAVDPYKDFFDAIKGESTVSRGHFRRDTISAPALGELVEHYFRYAKDTFGGNAGASVSEASPDDGVDPPESMSGIVSEFLKHSRLAPDIPTWAGRRLTPGNQWLPDIDPKTDPGDLPPKGSVVVGVIDRAVALHHRSQRLADGKTRLLGAWQQVADRKLARDLGISTRQPPSGLGLLKPDIDKALDAAALNEPEFAIDAGVFNRLVGQGDFEHPVGHRELSGALAHGTHVLDAATGVFPDASGADDRHFRDFVRAIVINLPDRKTIGLSSRNLSYFTILGILWMVHVADGYWALAHGASACEGDPKGYPMVINLSFAKQAGVRDGSDDVSRILMKLNAFRAQMGFYPVFLSLPAGNDNLERGNASVWLPSATSQVQPETQLAWRISPEDQSSNYVEIWFETENLDDPPELAVHLTDPDGNQSGLRNLAAGFMTGLGDSADGSQDIARVYYETREPLPDTPETPLKRYLICVAPTRLHDDVSPEAPAGVWLLTLRNLARRPVFVTANIQTDQSEQPGSRRSRASHFDDPDYHRFDSQTGRVRDSYNYPDHDGPGRYPPSDKRKDFDRRLPPFKNNSPRSPSKVRRHGTMNSIGNVRTKVDADGNYHPGSTIAGGYRLSDGKPAEYSSTGFGRRVFAGGRGIGAPTVACPSDDGYAHAGRLAAGSADGSVRAMQGTSFSAAQVTRLMAEILLDKDVQADRNFPLRKEIFDRAVAGETPPDRYGKFADPEKVGGGRFAMRARTRVDRRET